MIDLQKLPKAELHLHIEGTFEPELIFEIAARNGIALAYPNVGALRAAYQFDDLQAFLNLYYAGMDVLRTERDYRDLTMAYLRRAQAQNVRHAEIFFDPQAHTQRGVAFATVIDGISSALNESVAEFGISTKLIMCFLRDVSADSAMATLEEALPYREHIVAVGLDSAEIGNPPSKFQAVFDRARTEGFLTVAHAGEEGAPEYVWQALNLLHVSRVDHGVRSMEDPLLVEHLRRTKMPLTVCPLSNLRLKVVQSLADHPLKVMLDAGLRATVNSDDPAYFGGYIGENFRQTADALKLTDDELVTLAKNSFLASFLDDSEKHRHLGDIDEFVRTNVWERPSTAGFGYAESPCSG
ncbi:MAG: adenosine deaminase [Candidatus Eremiobacteraeota bacterium]|nr:adenosine deaminase [Candidatus Eremiobacteraeota bacterium]